ncbi:peptidoglycan-binding protein [Lasius niger]|uniref:Peptidoglycan-binding protein n=1 Tax=Lasius niger TaxID=67767 RepID=A0A0J7MX09_LASNI|nr:peptidoglycan-binding protein [Lasius niger]
MAIGGGPLLPAAEVDPEIAMIVPHLMQAAPTNFSCNILVEDENDAKVYYIFNFQIINQETLEEYLVKELLGDQEVQDDGCSPDPSNIPTSEVTDSGIPAETPAKPARTAVNRHQSSIAIESSSKERISRNSKKVQRIADLRKQNKLLFEIKKNHEMKVAKMKECHLNVIQELQQQHMAEIQELELRKATAETELAELRFAREKDYA